MEQPQRPDRTADPTRPAHPDRTADPARPAHPDRTAQQARPVGTRGPSRRAGDAVRVLAAVSVVVGGLWLGGVAAALFLLVLGGTVLPRRLGTPPPLDAAYGVALLASGWAAQLGWYERVWWLDVVAHTVTTGLIAAVAVLAAVRHGVVADPRDASLAHPVAGCVVVTTGLGATLSLLWEVGEWFGNAYLDPTINVGYTDTLGDLVAGAVGSLVAGACLARLRRSAPRVA